MQNGLEDISRNKKKLLYGSKKKKKKIFFVYEMINKNLVSSLVNIRQEKHPFQNSQ